MKKLLILASLIAIVGCGDDRMDNQPGDVDFRELCEAFNRCAVDDGTTISNPTYFRDQCLERISNDDCRECAEECTAYDCSVSAGICWDLCRGICTEH